MSTKFILFITIHLAALIYFVELMRRIYMRSKEYGLKDSPESLPFGFVRLRHVIILFAFSYAVWIIGSFFLYYFFIDPSIASSGDNVRLFNFDY